VRQKLNEGIAAVIADGTYDKLNARYWPFSVR
jgi:ABC-type amino acid transport substrate-binding protein